MREQLLILLTNIGIIATLVANTIAFERLREEVRQIRVASSNPPFLAQEPPLQPQQISIDAAMKASRPHQTESIQRSNDPRAPIRIVVFEDPNCSFCRKLHRDVISKIDQDAELPPIQITYRHFPIFGDKSIEIMKLVECAGTLGGSDLAATTRKAVYQGDAVSVDEIKQSLLKDPKVSEPALQQCLNDANTLAAIQRDAEVAQELGLTGTPFLQIESKSIFGYIPYNEFRQAVLNETK